MLTKPYKQPLLFLGLFLAGCGTTLKQQTFSEVERAAEVVIQREIALQDNLELQTRLFNVAYPILANAAPFCPQNQEFALGFFYQTESNYQPPWKDAAKKLLNLSPFVSITYIAPHGPAKKAGLNLGDRLLALGQMPIPQGKEGLVAIKNYIKGQQVNGAPISITYKRGEGIHKTTLTPEKVCAYGIRYQEEDVINAYADGKDVIINRGIIEFTRSDDELALIIGHEIAHNALNHIDKKYLQTSAGLLGGLLVDLLLNNPGGDFANLGSQLGGQAFSPEYEAEADYMGLYAAARAGFNVEKAAYFWRRMGARNKAAIAATTTHPATAERFIALEKTVLEIKEKRSQSHPLLPDGKTPPFVRPSWAKPRP